MSGPWGIVRLCQTSEIREVSSANRATCHTRGQGCGAEYRGCTLGSSSKVIFIQNHWAAGLNRSPDRRGADLRFQFLGLLRVVDVADDLPQQVARLGQKGSCGV